MLPSLFFSGKYTSLYSILFKRIALSAVPGQNPSEHCSNVSLSTKQPVQEADFAVRLATARFSSRLRICCFALSVKYGL